jgi:hypothetical protein
MTGSFDRIRYDRFIDESFVSSVYLGKLRAIVDAIRELQPKVENPQYAFDLHLREKSQIMVYHGGTCLLTIKVGRLEKYGHISFVSNSYKNKELCSEEFRLLSELNNLNDMTLVVQRITNFLLQAVRAVDKKWFSKEAFFASKLSIDYGANWHSGLDWMIIDREAVLGFDTSDLKNKYYQVCKSSTAAITRQLKDEDSKLWGKNVKNFGDEVDFLAIGPDGQLVCIELKHESFVSGIYWSPIQASVYREAFRGAIDAISDAIKKLVNQKVSLGLLPIEARDRLPDRFTSVESIVFVVCGERNSKCWDKLAVVRKMLHEPIDVYVSDLVGDNAKFTLLETA